MLILVNYTCNMSNENKNHADAGSEHDVEQLWNLELEQDHQKDNRQS